MYSRRKGLSPEEIKIIWDELPSDIETSEEDSSSDESFSPEQNKTNNLNSNGRAIHEISDSESEPRDDSGDEEVTPKRIWRKRDCASTIPIFTLSHGTCALSFGSKTLPTDFFLTFLDDDIISNIVFQTNLYSNQKQRNIKPISKEEFYGFLGLNMLFSYHRLPRIRNYWSSDIDYSVSVVPDTLTRNRYFQILGNLHINDNEAIPKQNTDRLYKIRPLIDKLNKNFQSLRMPNQVQSIDESMILFKGRSAIKQYNPLKPIKRGYKLWCRSDMSGYMYEFEVYQGKDDSEFKRFGLGGSIVQKLTKSLVNKNHIIMMDNYFSSVELYEYLKSVGIYACGTIRSNRKGLPALAADKTLKRGDFDSRVSDQGISYFKWKDNRSVFFLSNYHGTEICNVQRKQKDGSIMDIPAPTIVGDYNSHMGGVDKSDMLKSLYDRDRKAKKWWHRLFFGIIEIAMINSYVCYCEIQDKIPLLEYKRRVTQGLLTMSKVPSKKRGRPRSDGGEINELPLPKKRKTANFSVSDDIRKQNKGAHWPIFVKNRGRCEFCASKKIESRPHSQCTLCKVFLCVNEKKNCFYQYHD